MHHSDYTKKLETLLFFILEVILPKYSHFKSEFKNAIFSQNSMSGLIPSPSTEFKTISSSDNTINAINRANFMKTTLEGGFLKEIIEKYLEHHNTSKRDKFDLPMLTARKDDYKLSKIYGSYTTNNHEVNGMNNINNVNTNHDYPHYNYENNINPNHKTIPMLNNKSFNPHTNPVKPPPIKKEIQSEEKSNIFHSPNPFSMEDMNFTHSNIFSSPRCNRNENYLSFRNVPEEENKNNDNNLINLNIFNLSRNNSLDLNEFYKNGNNIEEDINKKIIDQNFAFDESYFSVSSDKNKN